MARDEELQKLHGQLNDLHDLHALLQLEEDHHEDEKERRKWVNFWAELRQPQTAILYLEFEKSDVDKFKQAFRMKPATFETLLSKILPDILKQDTQMRFAITPKTRLQITLRYLSSGANYRVLEELFRVPHQTISYIVPHTCKAIWSALAGTYIKCPSTEEEWLQVAKAFGEKWNYPFCLGALDGKHVTCQAFAKSGSLFKNYKGTFSIVLLALADANLKFLFVDIGQCGSLNDAGIFQRTSFKAALDAGQLHLPESPTGTIMYHFCGDDAFGMTERLMKPYPRNAPVLTPTQKVFNYRFSRARRTIENSFGLLSSKFRILRTPILLRADNAIEVVKATVALHNFLLEVDSTTYQQPGELSMEDVAHIVIPGQWETDESSCHMLSINQLNSGNNIARNQRDAIAAYFMQEGEIPWQWNMALGVKKL
jgi:hypothetical protein